MDLSDNRKNGLLKIKTCFTHTPKLGVTPKKVGFTPTPTLSQLFYLYKAEK